MEYKIKIERMEEPEEGSRYQGSTTIYEQLIADLDVEAVIKAANALE